LVHGRPALAVHDVDSAPVPERSTSALSSTQPLPGWDVALRVVGLTASASGTGVAVIVKLSMIRVGEPLAPDATTVMVST
jgi:hypothetical protein